MSTAQQPPIGGTPLYLGTDMATKCEFRKKWYELRCEGRHDGEGDEFPRPVRTQSSSKAAGQAAQLAARRGAKGMQEYR